MRAFSAVSRAVHVLAPVISASSAAAVAESEGTVAVPEGVNHMERSKISGPRSAPLRLSLRVLVAAILYL
jgi:hypothetical protein